MKLKKGIDVILISVEVLHVKFLDHIAATYSPVVIAK